MNEQAISLIDEMVAYMIQDLSKQTDDKIMERLKQLGHTFETNEQLISFAINRLEQHRNADYVEIVLDKTISVVKWKLNFEITQGYNDNGEFITTATQ